MKLIIHVSKVKRIKEEGKSMSLFKNDHPWRYAIGSWGGFVIIVILHLLFDYNIYGVLGMLTAAIILTLGTAIYILYNKWKSSINRE